MSTTPIAVVYNGQTVKVTAPVSGLTAAVLLTLIPTTFYGGVPVRLTQPSAPSVLLDPSTNLISGLTPTLTVGTLYTLNLVQVARYSITNTNDTNPLTNQVNIDYLPGITYVSGSLPLRSQVIADAVTAINVLKTANSLSTIPTPNTVGVSNDSAAGWYGLYTTSSSTILEASWLASGTYQFSPVVHYTIEVPHGANVIAEYLTNQTAGTLVAASGVPNQSNPFAGLFVNDQSATDSTAKSKLIGAGTTIAPLASTCSYIVLIVNQYTITQPAVTAGTITPLFNLPPPYSNVSASMLQTYALLAGGGGITNTAGATVVTGGFGGDSSGNQIITVTAGTITANSVSQSAGTTVSAANVVTAYGQIAALQTYLTRLAAGGAALSASNSGVTFTAGAYLGSGATTFGGTITLDAQNNPNAIFIFGNSTSFTFSAATTITLANGAQAGNVFFCPNGNISIGAASNLKGTFLAAGTLTDAGGSTITGQLITAAGLLTTNATTVTLASTPTTTQTVAAAAAVTTVVDTLEFQTPLYLLQQLSLSTSAYGLLDSNGNLLNNLIPVSPVNQFTVAQIATFNIYNYGNATAYTVRGSYTESLQTLMKDPSLAPLYVGVPAGQQLTFWREPGYNYPISRSLQLQNVQSSVMFTNVANDLSYNSITVNFAGSTLPPFQMNFANASTYGDTYTNVRAAAMLYYGGLVDSATTKYCLVNATVLTGANRTIAQPYGPFSTNSTPVSTQQVQSTDPVVFNLITLTAGQLAVTGGTTGTAYFPTGYTVADTKQFLINSGAQGMSVISGNPPATVWVLFSGSGAPFLPFQTFSAVAPTYNVAARQDTTMIMDLITDNDGTFTLSNISEQHTSDQFIAWAQNQFSDLASAVLTACIKSTGVIPVFSVLATGTVFPSPAAATSGTHNKLYIKNSVETVLIPPASIVRPNVDTVLPSSFTVYDLLNYAMTNFGFTNLLSYGMYPTADANQGVLGPLDSVASIVSEFNVVGKVTFQLVPASYAQVSIVYNGSTTVLQSMPVACSLGEVVATATVSLGISAPTVLELTSTTMQLSDQILTWASPPATTGGLYTLTLNLQTQVKENVVIYNSNGFIAFDHKESMNMTVAQLITAYIAALKLSPATQVTLQSLTTGTTANPASTIGTYSRSLQTAADTANLDQTDPTPVSKVSEFTATTVVQTMSVTVQDLFNINKSVTFSVPMYSTAAFVANQAVVQLGGYTSTPTATFGLAVAGTGVVLAATAQTNAATTYQLIETDTPLQWASVTVGYTDQSVPAKTSLLLASTPLNQIPGFQPLTDVLSLSNGGASLAPYTQTVGSIMPATGILQLYDWAQPNVSVTVSLNGTVKIVSVSPRAKLSDVLTALSVPATQNVIITEVKSGNVAQPTDALIKFTAPYSFTIVNGPTLYSVTVTYGTQTSTVQYPQGTTVAKIIADAQTAFSLSASAAFNLSITGQTAALAPTSAPDLTVNTAFTLTAAPAINTVLLVGGGGLALVAVFLAIFG